MNPVIERSKVVSALNGGFTVMGELKHKFNEQTFGGRNEARTREIVIELCPMAEYCYTISVTS
jgi:hypothetical protein